MSAPISEQSPRSINNIRTISTNIELAGSQLAKTEHRTWLFGEKQRVLILALMEKDSADPTIHRYKGIYDRRLLETIYGEQITNLPNAKTRGLAGALFQTRESFIDTMQHPEKKKTNIVERTSALLDEIRKCEPNITNEQIIETLRRKPGFKNKRNPNINNDIKVPRYDVFIPARTIHIESVNQLKPPTRKQEAFLKIAYKTNTDGNLTYPDVNDLLKVLNPEEYELLVMGAQRKYYLGRLRGNLSTSIKAFGLRLKALDSGEKIHREWARIITEIRQNPTFIDLTNNELIDIGKRKPQTTTNESIPKSESFVVTKITKLEPKKRRERPKTPDPITTLKHVPPPGILHPMGTIPIPIPIDELLRQRRQVRLKPGRLIGHDIVLNDNAKEPEVIKPLLSTEKKLISIIDGTTTETITTPKATLIEPAAKSSPTAGKERETTIVFTAKPKVLEPKPKPKPKLIPKPKPAPESEKPIVWQEPKVFPVHYKPPPERQSDGDGTRRRLPQQHMGVIYSRVTPEIDQTVHLLTPPPEVIKNRKELKSKKTASEAHKKNKRRK